MKRVLESPRKAANREPSASTTKGFSSAPVSLVVTHLQGSRTKRNWLGKLSSQRSIRGQSSISGTGSTSYTEGQGSGSTVWHPSPISLLKAGRASSPKTLSLTKSMPSCPWMQRCSIPEKRND